MNTVQITRRFTESAWGGTETVVLETSRRLQQLGHKSEIMTTTALDPARLSSIRGIRVERHPYFYPWLGLGRSDRRRLDEKGGNLFSLSLGRALARRGVDVIHLHTGKRLGGIVRTVARHKRVPYIVSLHGGWIDVPREEKERWTPRRSGSSAPLEWGKVLGLLVGSRRVLKDAAAVLCVNPSEREKIAERLPGQRVEWMPNGVDSQAFAEGRGEVFRARFGIPDSRRLLMVVGRVDPQKNQQLAVDILARLQAGGQPSTEGWHLAMIGPTTDLDYEQSLRERLDREADLAGRVTWIPGLESGSADLVNAYHAADFLLVPSIHEPFGIVVLEAWAAGTPVVASRVGGLAGLIRDEVDGLLVSGYSAREWADRIARLDSAESFRRSLCSTGLSRARNELDWSQITRRLEALYREVRSAHSASEP
ncbi:MAG: glycosyltransferase family 4 protein [Holophagales bacterium]|nr:glycosyltransferase family 4 protein [Holophagales bacterium]